MPESIIKIELGNCIELLKKLPSGSINQIFADPPYNLSGSSFQTVQSGKRTKCDKGNWDKIDNIHEFNEMWVKECIRVLTDDGTIWISGTLHNHPSIGFILKKLNLWIINDVIWFKRNATPLLSKNRLAPSTELIWKTAKTSKNIIFPKSFNIEVWIENIDRNFIFLIILYFVVFPKIF